MHLRVHLPQPANGAIPSGKLAEVWIDGERVDDVVDLHLHMDADHVATVRLTRLIHGAEIDVVAEEPV